MGDGVGGYACLIPNNLLERWKQELLKYGLDCEFPYGYKPFQEDLLIVEVKVIPNAFPAADRYGTERMSFVFESYLGNSPYQEDVSEEYFNNFPDNVQEIGRKAHYSFYFERIGNSVFSLRVLLFLGATLAIITDGLVSFLSEDYENEEVRELCVTGQEAIQYINRMMDTWYDQTDNLRDDHSNPPF